MAVSLAALGLRHWRDLPRAALVGLVQVYRYALRPVLGNRCRHVPTCSEYALEALQRHGAAVGSALAGRRLLRCHPFCQGGYDPVPEQAPRLFAFLGAQDRDNAPCPAVQSTDTPRAAQGAASPSILSNKSRTKLIP